MDGKCEIIKAIARESGTIYGEAAGLVAEAVGEVETLKQCRDAVIHARLHDPKADVAHTFSRRGKVYEVFISETALQTLYARILASQKEMQDVIGMLAHHFPHYDLIEHEGDTDPNGVRAGQYFQVNLARLRERQTHRRSLPEIPQFPLEYPTHPTLGHPAAPPD